MANQLVIKLAAENSKLNNALGSSTKQVKRLEKQVESLKKQSGGAFGGLKKSAMGSIGPLAGVAGAFAGIGGAAHFLEDSVKATKSLALSTAKLSRETGMDVRSASEWISLAKERGIGTEKLSLTFSSLAKQMHAAAGGAKKSAEALASVGVSGKLIQSGDLDGSLSRIADSFKAMKDGPDKTAIALQLFGRQGKALLPILNQGSAGVARLREEMRQHGLVMSKGTISKTKELAASQRDLNETVEGLKVQIGSALIPILARGAKTLVTFIDKAKNSKAFTQLKVALHNVWVALKSFVQTLRPAAEGLIKFLSQNPEVVKFAVALLLVGVAVLKTMKVVNSLVGTLKTFATFMRLLPLSMGPVGIALMALTVVAVLVITHWKQVKGWLSSFFGWLSGAVGTVAGVATRIGTALWHGITGLIGGLGSFVSSIFNGVVGVIKTYINTIISGVNLLIDGANSVGGVVGVHIGHIPHLARGGIVNGGRLALIGEDGPEAVVPLGAKYADRRAAVMNAAGLGGHTFNITNIGNQLDEAQLASSIGWQLQTRGIG